MQGQAGVFARYSKEKIPFAIQRYVGETERLMGVLDARLANGREYVVGAGKGKYSIADIACFGWVNSAPMVGISLKEQFPNLYAWVKRVNERPAVQRGLKIPKEPMMTVLGYEKQTQEDDGEFREREGKILEQIKSAKEQFGYKYKSP